MRVAMSKRLLAVSIASVLGVVLAASGANAAKYGPGASDKEIKIGQTMPYSGPASAYGSIGKAEVAYFKMVNEQGGINGRQINIISLDDGYSPPKAVEQVRKLVEQEEVLFLFQNLGTPSNSAIHKYVNAKKVPHLFIATGATKWGDYKHYPWTMGWQPNYQSEAKAYAAYVLKNHPNAKVGILYQNDDYGKDYLHGFKEGLGDKAAKMIVKEVSYETSDPTVDSQIVELKSSGADVFFNVTTPKFAAQSIRKAFDIGWKPVHLLNNVSANIKTVFTPAGLDKSKGIISSQYIKDIADTQWQKDKDYLAWKAWMEKYNPGISLIDGNYVYGYSVAYTLHQVLKAAGDDLTRENVMRQAANLKNLEVPMLLPGVTISTSPTDYYPIESVQLAKFDGEKFEAFGAVIGK
ncbi:MAG: branched-chain amino acid ABC transporter substrate-binding protein [Candidatus Muproteobacteria bacterium RBG_16_60_9]|uniref:Branched-chain amino acid ABC transporter substrate-binding protein n=1 Tax=Candidatus Muproteobacteria bacterium RBG_16_60_9 TaxID=1817755 RepID=A0A1F6VBF8_9PROT|nr:MAG: branched-chain amino acid ABC transporter substrate-binding protein [Candidatus Muproteobacteria bacterium RBG_16_60_9]